MRDVELIRKLLELRHRVPLHQREIILGSMTTKPDPLAVYAYTLFIHTNIGDPELYKPLYELGKRTIKEIAGELLDANKQSDGMVVSGGTESNYIAIYSAIKKTGREVVLAPDTVHVSIDKACMLQKCRLVKIPVDGKPLTAPIAEEYLRRYNPAALVVTAGTTERGLIDGIRELSEIALQYNVWLHVDAAYGGLLIPFLYKHGYVDEDLKLYPGVTSISIDFHKNGLAPIPLGTYIVSSPENLEYAKLPAPYTLTGYNPGILGTRPGGSIAALWALWEKYGVEGYEELALRMMRTAIEAYRMLGVNKDLEVLEPILPIVLFRHKKYKARQIMSELSRRKIYVYKAPSYNALRIVVMPHVTIRQIEKLSNALKNI